jgi:hypothetical protein
MKGKHHNTYACKHRVPKLQDSLGLIQSFILQMKKLRSSDLPKYGSLFTKATV